VRRGAIVVGEARAEVMQAAAPCQFTAAPASLTVDAAGGDRAITIETLEGCQWTAASGAPWISITGTRNTNGPGSLTVHIDANSGGEPRTGSFVAAGQSIQVSQGSASSPCTYGLDPPSAIVEAEGGSVRFNVAARTGCGWRAVGQAPWIQVVGDGVGAGNGAVSLTVAPNTGTSRIGIVALQDQAFTIVQAASPSPCSYDIAPSGVNVGAVGGPSTITVTTQPSCTWTAASQVPWIMVASGSGIGSGTVGITIAANTGAARSGTVAIAGRAFTVSQEAAAPACAYSIAPVSFAAPAAASTTSVDVTTQSGCAWTAVSQASWITVTAGGAGTGNGRVELAIAANTGAARSSTVTIAGRSYTVNQAAVSAPCTYTIAPTSVSPPRDGGSTFVDVTTQSGCAWTAVSNDAWIVVTGGASGNGNGRVDMTIGANPNGPRTGTVTIAGQPFTVQQAARPCAYTIAPTTFSAPVPGGAVEVAVTTDATCGWTAVSQAPWIAIRIGATGTGSGHVVIDIAANTAAARTGTVDIAGQVFTVTQGAPCSFTFTPPSLTIPAAGATTTVDVLSASTCSWTAVSQVPWITVTRGASGTGDGRIELVIAANAGPARSGTVTIAGQTYVVNQEGTMDLQSGVLHLTMHHDASDP
jgi:trimeric autotransporter adhesin